MNKRLKVFVRNKNKFNLQYTTLFPNYSALFRLKDYLYTFFIYFIILIFAEKKSLKSDEPRYDTFELKCLSESTYQSQMIIKTKVFFFCEGTFLNQDDLV